MAEIIDMSGKRIEKKPVVEEDFEKLTYKEIMQIIIKYSTEDICHKIFVEGGVSLCPSKVFVGLINSKLEEEDCEIKSIGCTTCWSRAIQKLKGKE